MHFKTEFNVRLAIQAKGRKAFENKDYASALRLYEDALTLT